MFQLKPCNFPSFLSMGKERHRGTFVLAFDPYKKNIKKDRKED